MPLNIQISYGYSRYLDVKLKKYLEVSSVNKLTVTLAYKELATFNFVPFSSNISPNYKGCIVPNYMHRIYNRCTSNSSRSHHLQFMLKILKNREQDFEIIMKKFRKSIDRIKQVGKLSAVKMIRNRPLLVHYNNASKSHILVTEILRNAYMDLGLSVPPVVHRGLPKIMAMLTSKRADIKKVCASINSVK